MHIFYEGLWMRQFQLALVLALFVMGMPAVSDTDASSPLRLGDIAGLLKNGDTHVEVLYKVRERGAVVALSARHPYPTLDKRDQESLAKLGFTADHMQIIAGIRDEQSVFLPGDSIPWEFVERHTGVALTKRLERKALDPADLEPGYPTRVTSGKGATQYVRTALRKAGKSETQAFERFTLHGNKQVLKAFEPMLRKLDQDLAKRFPPQIANVTSADTLHLVVLNSNKDFAEVASAYCRLRGYSRKLRNPKAFSETLFWTFNQVVFVNAGRADSVEQAGRLLAFGAGKVMMTKLARGKQTQAMAAGFGSVIEAMAFETPSIQVREFVNFESKQAWADALAKAKGDPEISDISLLLLNDQPLTKERLAFAWSLTEYLLKKPDDFHYAIHHCMLMLRPADALRWGYGEDLDALRDGFFKGD